MTTYLDGDKINYGRLLTDEVLAVDRLLVKAAKKNMDVAGKKVWFPILCYYHANTNIWYFKAKSLSLSFFII